MHKKILTAILICAIGVFFCVSAVNAAEQENKVVRFFKNLINWPFNITKKGAETVGRTTKRSVTTVTTTGSSAVETVTGKPEKIKDVVVEPVKGTGETAMTAIEGSLKTPIEGTTETFKEKK